jgi:hypothetical protein
VIAWGPSPTSGELGFGEATRSSTKPKLVDNLTGSHVFAIACGLSATLLLVDTTSDTPEGKVGALLTGTATSPPSPTTAAKVFPLGVYDPVEPAPRAGAGGGAGAAAAPAVAGGKGGKRKAEPAAAAPAAAGKKAKK